MRNSRLSKQNGTERKRNRRRSRRLSVQGLENRQLLAGDFLDLSTTLGSDGPEGSSSTDISATVRNDEAGESSRLSRSFRSPFGSRSVSSRFSLIGSSRESSRLSFPPIASVAEAAPAATAEGEETVAPAAELPEATSPVTSPVEVETGGGTSVGFVGTPGVAGAISAVTSGGSPAEADTSPAEVEEAVELESEEAEVETEPVAAEPVAVVAPEVSQSEVVDAAVADLTTVEADLGGGISVGFVGSPGVTATIEVISASGATIEPESPAADDEAGFDADVVEPVAESVAPASSAVAVGAIAGPGIEGSFTATTTVTSSSSRTVTTTTQETSQEDSRSRSRLSNRSSSSARSRLRFRR